MPPDYKIRLLLLGNVSLKYIALATVVLDLLSMTSQNAGGHIAHLGGALFGYLFATSYKKGRDLTKGFNRMGRSDCSSLQEASAEGWSQNQNLPARVRPEIRATTNTCAAWQENSAEIDRILDKIKQSGYTSLTREEKQRLFDAGKK